MLGSRVVVVTRSRPTRRQIARALFSAATDVVFGEGIDEFDRLLRQKRPDLIILDCDQREASELSTFVDAARRDGRPVVLLSVQPDKQALLELLSRYELSDIGSLIAKHGSEETGYPALDERELLVTCEKVVRKDIFGIEKYVGSWGILLHHDTITSRANKQRALAAFSAYLKRLDCQPRIASSIVTVAEELILNAVVHAPVDQQGRPKYEQLPLQSDLPLEPHEYVEFRYGCDGQRLMIAVSDNFGRLDRTTLKEYLCRTFAMEDKPSGAGVGLGLTLDKIHQLIFNVQESKKTEAIAGWYLGVHSTGEFLSVGKSLNVFHLSPTSEPVRSIGATMFHLSGQVTATTDLSAISQADMVDMRNVVGFTSGGIRNWMGSTRERSATSPLTIVGCPEPMVNLAVGSKGFLLNVHVASVWVPFKCPGCQFEMHQEMAANEILGVTDTRCERCDGELVLAGDAAMYGAFTRLVGHAATRSG